RVPAEDRMPRGGRPRGEQSRLRPLTDEDRAQLATIPGIETQVWAQIERIIRDPAIIAEAVERVTANREKSVLTSDLEAAQTRMARIDRKRAHLLARYTASDDDDDDALWKLVEEGIASLETEKAALLTAVADLERRVTQEQADAGAMLALHAYC